MFENISTRAFQYMRQHNKTKYWTFDGVSIHVHDRLRIFNDVVPVASWFDVREDGGVAIFGDTIAIFTENKRAREQYEKFFEVNYVDLVNGSLVIV